MPDIEITQKFYRNRLSAQAKVVAMTMGNYRDIICSMIVMPRFQPSLYYLGGS